MRMRMGMRMRIQPTPSPPSIASVHVKQSSFSAMVSRSLSAIRLRRASKNTGPDPIHSSEGPGKKILPAPESRTDRHPVRPRGHRQKTRKQQLWRRKIPTGSARSAPKTQCTYTGKYKGTGEKYTGRGEGERGREWHRTEGNAFAPVRLASGNREL
ncbi:hypothetical protein BO71DRAFT_117624 [Aspergillus ellipticus CBS 707.79]|uniref:Uncharacterized protein n=1 Tax=Aspergillus ellipticus CBS 707.79 TaxID=1448320 RepID=A0A319CV29_9EURO|nr:hypothetical protein BO71DRAFT_117624 [Aspergillus ellipticus CBS 707.79]